MDWDLEDNTIKQLGYYVNGDYAAAKHDQTFDVIDPGTGAAWAKAPDCSESETSEAISSCHESFQTYSKTTPRHRAKLLMKWHELILQEKEQLARLLTYETGKPLAEARGEIDYGLTFVWWFSGEADRGQHGTTLACAIEGRRAFTIKQPIGVVAALVPWNFPIALFLRKAAAALAAGCTMVVKTSPETPITAVAIAKIASNAGFPPGALNILTTSLENTPSVAEVLCRHPLVKKVSFTGSTRVGRIIAGLCAENLKKTTLELGGNCPFIVFDDANLSQAMDQLMALKWRHAGQACITSNKLYVQDGIHDEFVKELISRTEKLKMGRGKHDDTTLGPLTTVRGLNKAEELYQDAVAKGAKTALGSGQRGDTNGYFMAPTILTNMSDDMNMAEDEIFAPILGVFRFRTEEEVTKRANETPLGLASYVFTKNIDRIWRMFENLEAGMIGLVSESRKPLTY